MLKTIRALALASGASAIFVFAAAATFAPPAYAFKASAALNAASGALTTGYQAAPALMLGLGLAAALSLLTFFAFALRPTALPIEATRRLKSEPDDAHEPSFIEASEAIAPQPFVEIEGASGTRCAILRDMLRIGREDDNDIRIPSNAVQRYHAAIHREDYDDWHITALSGGSKGLIVNGQRCSEARLHDGDVIQLGPGRLRFRAGYA